MPASPGLTYQDDFSDPRDRGPINALLQEVFGLDVSPLGELDL